MSMIQKLNDHCFNLATKSVIELCRAVEEETGRKPTLEDFCELITWGFRSCSEDILEDVNTANVLELKPKVKKKGKIILKPGDVVAIPAKEGDFYLAVYVTLAKRYGHAFGVFKGRHKLKPLAPGWRGEPIQPVFFTTDMFVASGRWRIIGHAPELLSLFPQTPERYYAKR